MFLRQFLSFILRIRIWIFCSILCNLNIDTNLKSVNIHIFSCWTTPLLKSKLKHKICVAEPQFRFSAVLLSRVLKSCLKWHAFHWEMDKHTNAKADSRWLDVRCAKVPISEYSCSAKCLPGIPRFKLKFILRPGA